MTTYPLRRTILMAEDDEEDQLFVREALEASGYPFDLFCVKDGQALLEYLNMSGRNLDIPNPIAPLPDIILLDLNMPRKDGREVLSDLKNSPNFKSIPIVVLTTSSSEADILASYEIGANTYITKPVTDEGLLCALQAIAHYWFEIAQLPGKNRRIRY
jgi:CheY-like chemotaxis protein